LVPMAMHASLCKRLEALPPEQFTPQWAGYATTKQPYTPVKSHSGPFYQLIQRLGERPDEWKFNAFLSTTDRDEAEALSFSTVHFFLLNGDMELNKNRQIFVNKML